MNMIANKLGLDVANRVLIDLAVSKDPNTVRYLADPVLERRKRIDSNYW